MSSKYATVKEFFDAGLWDKEKVKQAAVKGWITPEEFTAITGEAYTKG